MNNFLEFIEDRGIQNAEGTAIFVQEFLEDPGIYFKLSESERRMMESKIDEILFFFKE